MNLQNTHKWQVERDAQLFLIQSSMQAGWLPWLIVKEEEEAEDEMPIVE